MDPKSLREEMEVIFKDLRKEFASDHYGFTVLEAAKHAREMMDNATAQIYQSNI